MGILFNGVSVWAKPEALHSFLENHCFDCHDQKMQKGILDLESLDFELGNSASYDAWVLVHDKVQNGEMPPKKKRRPKQDELATFFSSLSPVLTQAAQNRVAKFGRATVRRLNRFEFENSLRDRLSAPWLLVADMLPEDGTAHLFNKVGERLDMSHVQISKFYEAAEYAVWVALQTVEHESRTQ